MEDPNLSQIPHKVTLRVQQQLFAFLTFRLQLFLRKGEMSCLIEGAKLQFTEKKAPVTSKNNAMSTLSTRVDFLPSTCLRKLTLAGPSPVFPTTVILREPDLP